MENMESSDILWQDDKYSNSGFLDDYFKKKAEEIIIAEAKTPTPKTRTVSSMDFFSLKNELYMHLIDQEIFDYFDDVVSDQSGTQTLQVFMENVSGFKEKKLELESEVDDYSYVALRRLRMFTYLNRGYLADKTREERRAMRNWHSVQVTSANFVGHCAMNKNLDRDYVVWARSDYTKKHRDAGLLKKDTPDQPHLFFLFFKRGSEHPYSIIHPLHEDKLSTYDPTNITKVLCDEVLDQIGDAHLVNFWDQYEFFTELYTGQIPIDKLIDIRTPQKRFKFLRQYFCGLSQTQLANELMKIYGIKMNQKNIEYWEKSSSDIPPFFKGDILTKVCEIFVAHSDQFFKLTMRSSLDDPPLTKDQTVKRLMRNLRSFPNGDASEFFNRLTKYDVPTVPKSDTARFKDAQRRYGFDMKVDQKRFMKLNEVPDQKMSDWFYVLANISEYELIKDMQTVYDNDKTRAKIYNLWHRIITNTIYPDHDKV